MEPGTRGADTLTASEWPFRASVARAGDLSDYHQNRVKTGENGPRISIMTEWFPAYLIQFVKRIRLFMFSCFRFTFSCFDLCFLNINLCFRSLC